MLTKFKAAAIVAALAIAPLAVVAEVADRAEAAGKYYSSCDALHRDYAHGVAKSAAAASRAVRDGYGRPATTKKAKAVYSTNHSRLDRDDDGTACEA